MKYVLWGTTGQAKVVRPILDGAGHELAMLVDGNPDARSPFTDLARVTAAEDVLAELPALGNPVAFAVAIGGNRGRDRVAIAARLQAAGCLPLTAIHSSAVVAETATIAFGVQVLAGACVSEDAAVGPMTILNTNSTVDHDCRLGEGVHVMPGATLAGEVVVENYATIGTNATILPRLRIGEGAYVGAGAVVTKDVPPNTVVVGVPARVR